MSAVFMFAVVASFDWLAKKAVEPVSQAIEVAVGKLLDKVPVDEGSASVSLTIGASLLLYGSEGGLDLLGMLFGLCLQGGPCDLSILDDERLPFGKSHGRRHAEGFRDLAIAVRN
jgi:hypothetical protein